MEQPDDETLEQVANNWRDVLDNWPIKKIKRVIAGEKKKEMIKEREQFILMLEAIISHTKGKIDLWATPKQDEAHL